MTAPKSEEPVSPASPAVEPLTFEQVLLEELDALEEMGKITRRKKVHPFHQAHASQLAGLAFSGGGIRSATFNLGVLQALAKAGLLSSFHYLSTVSGGGYIGSWLSAWIKRKKMKQVEEGLEREIDLVTKDSETTDTERSPITFLRQFSNYLTPSPGLFSLDTWTAVAAYLTNLLLNLTVLALGLASLLLLPRLFAQLVMLAGGGGRSLEVLVWLAVLLILLALFSAGSSLKRAEKADSPQPAKAVFWTVVIPLFAAAVGLALGISSFDGTPTYRNWALAGAGVYFLCWLVTLMWTMWSGERPENPRKRARTRIRWRRGVQAALPVGAAAGLALCWLARAFSPYSWIDVTILGPPAIVGVFSLTVVLHIGLVGSFFEETQRQWLNRLGAWLLILALGWLGVFSLVFYGPVLVKYLGLRVKGLLSASWILATAGGIVAGRRPESERGSSRWVKLASTAAPYVFMLGLLAALSLATHEVANFVQASGNPRDSERRADLSLVEMSRDERPVSPPMLSEDPLLVGRLLALFGALAWASIFLSRRVDINEFSMHHFYRNRLIRAYLGASRIGDPKNGDSESSKRQANPFTGFAPDDDLPLWDLNPLRPDEEATPRPYNESKGLERHGPIQILNTTLNVTSGQELGSQERKASSFFFTPFHYGFNPGRFASGKSESGFRRISDPEPTLGTALAISGAAVNPNMGYKSSPALAFLMTVFNTRLGWWVKNPSQDSSAQIRGIFALFSELFGRTTASADYVNLADGGFFDNLGIYELVRRRCRFILACDVEADPKYEFNALGNAIRRCRSDFGIDIDIQLDPIRKQAEDGFSRWHCAVGKIRYRNADKWAADGRLVYLKASLTGDEPEDLLNYASRNPDFPHESTADQWFGESQFESYRTLGYHQTDEMLRSAGVTKREPANIESVFGLLARAWYPPSTVPPGASTRHSEKLDEIFERLRSDPDLAFLHPDTLAQKPSLASPEAQERAGFYLCRSMMLLMESVYSDLALEKEHGRPNNRGWMNLFRGWARTPILQKAWATSAGSQGERFQAFCEREFRLRLGTLWVEGRNLGADRSKLDFVITSAKRNKQTSPRESRILARATVDAELREDESQKKAPVLRLCLLHMSVLTSEAAAQQRARGPLEPREQPDKDDSNLTFPVGIALVTLEEERGPEDKPVPSGEGEAVMIGTLRLLRIRSPYRGQGLARVAMERLFVDHNVRTIKLLRSFEGLLGPRASGAQYDRFKSVQNEIKHQFDGLLPGSLRLETRDLGLDRSRVDPELAKAHQLGDLSSQENEILTNITIKSGARRNKAKDPPANLTLCFLRVTGAGNAGRGRTVPVGVALVSLERGKATKTSEAAQPGTLRMLSIRSPFRGLGLGREAIARLAENYGVTEIALAPYYKDRIGPSNTDAMERSFGEVLQELQNPPVQDAPK